MLTKRQNLLETIKGGKPDRFVNQYEFMEMIMEAGVTLSLPAPGEMKKDIWGITWLFKEGQYGPFPVHDEEHKVIKDILKWKEQVKIPVIPTDDATWAAAVAHAEAVDTNEYFKTVFVAPGIFEMTHHLMSMEDALTALYEEPEAMHELIEAITEFELSYAKILCSRIKPDCLFHHDDWGSQISSFISPEMFDEFFVPAYKKIYSFYKENGVELVVHHSDSFAANLVPSMIEMGIDIWQGVMVSNNINELIEKYGDKITFMGGLDSGAIDFPGWTPELVAKEVEAACKLYGKKSFIPCLTMGLGISLFPGCYEEACKEIDRMSKEMF